MASFCSSTWLNDSPISKLKMSKFWLQTPGNMVIIIISNIKLKSQIKSRFVCRRWLPYHKLECNWHNLKLCTLARPRSRAGAHLMDAIWFFLPSVRSLSCSEPHVDAHTAPVPLSARILPNPAHSKSPLPRTRSPSSPMLSLHSSNLAYQRRTSHAYHLTRSRSAVSYQSRLLECCMSYSSPHPPRTLQVVERQSNVSNSPSHSASHPMRRCKSLQARPTHPSPGSAGPSSIPTQGTRRTISPLRAQTRTMRFWHRPRRMPSSHMRPLWRGMSRT